MKIYVRNARQQDCCPRIQPTLDVQTNLPSFLHQEKFLPCVGMATQLTKTQHCSLAAGSSSCNYTYIIERNRKPELLIKDEIETATKSATVTAHNEEWLEAADPIVNRTNIYNAQKISSLPTVCSSFIFYDCKITLLPI